MSIACWVCVTLETFDQSDEETWPDNFPRKKKEFPQKRDILRETNFLRKIWVSQEKKWISGENKMHFPRTKLYFPRKKMDFPNKYFDNF